MIEEIAIVNNKDEVVGKANRKEVHKKGLLHREAYVQSPVISYFMSHIKKG